jgi:hypothetical protein
LPAKDSRQQNSAGACQKNPHSAAATIRPKMLLLPMPLRHPPSVPLPPLSTMIAVDEDHHRRSHHRPPLLLTMTTIAAVDDKQRPLASGGSLSTVWQRQWRSSTAAIAVVVDGSGNGIEPTVLILASLTVVVVDGGRDDGVFTNASHDNDRHPRPHRPHPPLDKDWMVGWRVRRDASHLSSPRSSSLVSSLSPVTG